MNVKEALMVIASAWSVAFIVLFLAALTIPPHSTGYEYARIVFVLLIGAIFGSGWLKFRHDMKQLRDKKGA